MRPDRAWVLLKSGRRLDLLDPHPNSWTDEDLATGLSRTYRWGGHSRWNVPLSVAQHSLTVLHISLMRSNSQLSAAEQMRELAHDMDEGLLGYDAITPLKPHLGEGYERVVERLGCAIAIRYGLQPWDEASLAAHKHADRLAAASEARHVVGWSLADIRFSLGIATEPMTDDPVPVPAGMQPWQPWPPDVAARLFLERLHELQGELPGSSEGNPVITPDTECPAASEPVQPEDRPTFVIVEGGHELVQGQVIQGVRDENGAWDFDGLFTVKTEDGELIKVHGWNCITEVQ